ncbi:MAG: hypothetical protein F2817_04030 [Actinobacteria bacterium]|nr:hypothetical protein [Actinomycetota bacterium]
MRVRVAVVLVGLAVLPGCGQDAGTADDPPPPPPPVVRGTALDVGRAHLVVPLRWRPASPAAQRAVRAGTFGLPTGAGSAWLLKGSGGDTGMTITVDDLTALGGRGEVRLDTRRGSRDYIAGIRSRLRKEGIRGARFVRRPVVRLDGTRAALIDAYIPDPTGGQVLLRVLATVRERRIYQVQINGPTTDGPAIRDVVDGVLLSWEWDRCASDRVVRQCANG